jgi:hypothetical protein
MAIVNLHNNGITEDRILQLNNLSSGNNGIQSNSSYTSTK